MERQRIYNRKNNGLNEKERLELANLLLKAGYAVKIGREKRNANSTAYTYFVEHWVESDNG
ncbi:MAG: resolvase [Clostridiales bacterium]|nr:resolvase [Clostridiales bacterium]